MDVRRREEALFSSWGKGRFNSGKNGNSKDARTSTSGSGCEYSHSINVDVDVFDDDDDILAQAYDDEVEDMQAKGPKSLSFSNKLKDTRDASGNEHLPPVPHSTPLESLPGFDVDAGQTWIYPVNYPLREYQYSIVEKALHSNTLVSLPTGLGKTFIAAVVMYNFYRWYPRSKIVFMAPTKPLVAQQIEACFSIVGMPQQDTSQLTGAMAPECRVQAWAEKRVFFLTPQVLTNDLSRGACPAKLIKCLVLDEAHRALGNHAYCQVVRELREYRHDFRILALSATPGSDLQAVQRVITNLMISHIELRSEDNPDIKPYLHHRSIEKVVVPLGEELTHLKTKYLNVLRVYVSKLLDMKVLFTRDETTLSKFQILQARDAFRQNPPDSLPAQRYGVVEGLFALCMTLYHSYELMLQHGTRSFYKFLKDTLQGDKGYSFARSELLRNKVFQDLMEELAEKFEPKSSLSQSSKHHSSQMFSEIGPPHSPRGKRDLPFVISHPKIAKLLSIVIDHHQKFAEKGTSTRIMIFSQYRDSVLEITELLQSHSPLVKAMSFIGQSSVARGGRGISQKEQLRVVKQFREGGFNTLISTCVGEEGLDIGEVDLIICYDAPKSPIRLVQRMGRTGRKREGRIVVLVTKGKEEQMYNHSQYQKKRINAALANKGKLSQFLNPHSPCMIPKGITPVCMKLHMKVGTWKVQMGRGRKSTIDSSTSVSSLLCDSNSSLSNSKRNHMKKADLSKEEWAWWSENLQVPTVEVKTIPQPSLTCLGTHDPEKDSTSVSYINLGNYQPWQTLAQTTHIMGHSTRTFHLVQLTEFIGLQYHFDPGDDPYGLEMATFLDMAYVKGSSVDRPSLFTAVRSEEPRGSQHMLMSQRSATVKKGSGRKNSCASKGKKKKVVQSSLITSMLIQKPRVQIEKEKFEKCQDLVDFDIGDTKRSEEKSDSEDSDIYVIKDDNIISNLKGNTDVNDHQVVTSSRSSSEDIVSNHSKKRELGNQLDFSIDESPSQGNSQIYNCMRESLTSLPPGQQSPLHILTPPSEVDFSCDVQETTEPASPSDVILVYNEWMEKKKRDIEKKKIKSRGDALNEACDIDMFAQTYNDTNSETGGNNFSDLPDLCGIQEKNTNEKSFEPKITVHAIPVLGNEMTTEACKTEKNKAISKTGENQEQNVTPQKIFNHASTSSDTDISPVINSTYRKPVRTNLPLYSSTPKVNAKRLFKVETPDLTAIKHCSPISRERESLNTPVKLCHANDSREQIRSKDLEKVKSQSSSHSVLSQRNKVRKKLSRFALPERSESKDEIETLSAQKVNTYTKTMHMDTDIVEQKSKGKFTEKSVVCEDDKDILTDEKRHRGFNNTENFRKDRNFTELNVQEITAETNTVEDRNRKTDMIKDSENKSNLKNSVQICSPKQKSNEARDVFDEAYEYSVLSCSEGFSITNTIEIAPEHDSKKGSVSSEVNKLSAIECSKQSSVNFNLSLDDHLFADIEVKEPDQVKFATLALPSSSNKRNYIISKNIKSNINYSSSNLLSVTQIVELIDETAVDEQFKEGNSTFSHQSLQNTLQSVGKSSLSLTSKLDKHSHHNYDKYLPDKILVNKGKPKNVDTSMRMDIAPDVSSPERLKQVKESVTPNFSLLDDIVSDEGSKHEEEEKQQSSVHFDLLGTGKFEPMSESLLADIEVNMQMEAHQRKQSSGKEEKANDGSDYLDKKNDDSSFIGNQIHISVISGKEKSQIGTQTQDITNVNSSVRLEVNSHLTSPNTQVWLRRKRKVCAVVESDTELSSDSGNVIRRSVKSLSNKTSSFRNIDKINQKKKNLGVNFSLDDDDDDFQDDLAVGYQDIKDKLENKLNKKPKRCKKKRNEFVEEEAEVSEDCNSLSSDESDANEEEYDHSFVDDCTQGTQDAAVDMKAVYLQSVVSPLKKGKRNHHQYHSQPPQHLSDTPESTEELDEEEDSFVVDNNFVEYDTEYLGDTMLAEDPIIIQALHDKASTEKAKDTKMGKTCKRKRIIFHDSSSDEETAAEKKINDVAIIKQKSDDKGKSDVQSDKAREISPRASNASVVKTTKSDTVQLMDHQSTKLTEEAFPRLSAWSNQLEISEFSEFEQSLHDKASTKKAKDTQNGSKFRRKRISFHDLSSDEDTVAENKSIKINSVLLTHKPIDNGKSDSQSNKEKSLGFETLQYKDHQNTNVTKEDKSVFSQTSKSGQVTTMVLVDSLEIAGGGNIVSKLRNHYGAFTSVVQLAHAHYAVSTRMAVTRLLHSVFSSSQQRAKLVQQVQGMLDLYDRPVIIVEMDRIKMGEPLSIRKNRSRYLDTITCACTQVTQLKVLYSGSQEETTHLLWQLVEQEKTKGYSIPVLPEHITQLKQMVNFYRSLPRISYASAVYLAHKFSTVVDFVNSSVEVMQEKGCISIHRATTIKQYLCRIFRADMLPSQ